MHEQVWKRFAALVREMRAAQREYFETRSPQSLDLALQLERAVDRNLKELFDREQARLF